MRDGGSNFGLKLKEQKDLVEKKLTKAEKQASTQHMEKPKQMKILVTTTSVGFWRCVPKDFGADFVNNSRHTRMYHQRSILYGNMLMIQKARESKRKF